MCKAKHYKKEEHKLFNLFTKTNSKQPASATLVTKQ